MKSSEYNNKMSRREFLRIPQAKNEVTVVLDKERCTGCGLCTIDCPTKALRLSLNRENDTYQILFQQEICNACGICEKSCPEGCLRMMDQEPERKKIGKDAQVIFDDKISKCMGCGISLYPQAMIQRLESKLFVVKEHAWTFHLCPSCRMKTQFAPRSFHPLKRGCQYDSQPGRGRSEKTRA
jgi:ferredoxin